MFEIMIYKSINFLKKNLITLKNKFIFNAKLYIKTIPTKCHFQIT
jgi:hypothetical protein